MCGRFALFSKIDVIMKYADLIESNVEWSPHYNIAPSISIPVLLNNNNKIELSYRKWGYMPDFVYHSSSGKQPFTIINAKSETITEKPTFKGSFDKRRCLIPANGFYEWRKADRQPYYITVKDEPLFFFAGIWNDPQADFPENEKAFAIITTKANGQLLPIHHRMPVIINPSSFRDWLFSTDQSALLEMLKPYPVNKTLIQPVSKEVNNSAVNHQSLIEPVVEKQNQPEFFL
jgi:putative SOS response-associated peptidase YedK